MKKWVIWLCAIFAVLVVARCALPFIQYTKNRVEITGIGSFCLPDGWVYEETDGIALVRDANDKDHVYMVGEINESDRFSGISRAMGQEVVYDRDMQNSIGTSYSAVYGDYAVFVDGESRVKSFLGMYPAYESGAIFLVWDEEIPLHVTGRIGNSFRPLP